jgi:hypothetical protein
VAGGSRGVGERGVVPQYRGRRHLLVVSDDFALGDLTVTVLAPEKVVAELVRH